MVAWSETAAVRLARRTAICCNCDEITGLSQRRRRSERRSAIALVCLNQRNCQHRLEIEITNYKFVLNIWIRAIAIIGSVLREAS